VSLFYQPPTVATLGNLHALSQLQTLELGGTGVSDAALVYLQGLSQLQYLDLSGTNVTDQGVKKLQQALPNCEIER
jgi:internalin A